MCVKSDSRDLFKPLWKNNHRSENKETIDRFSPEGSGSAPLYLMTLLITTDHLPASPSKPISCSSFTVLRKFAKRKISL